jgi:hypothetical protein
MEKPSVRTRVSFTVGVRELGGDVGDLAGSSTKVGSGEHPAAATVAVGPRRSQRRNGPEAFDLVLRPLASGETRR